MKLAVVIPTHNRLKMLRRLLQSLREEQYGFTKPETIVVNDGSSDGTGQMLTDEFPEVTVVNGDGNWWWTKCINQGIIKAREASIDLVLLLNDDSEIKSGFLNSLMHDYNHVPSNSLLGCTSCSLDETPVLCFAGNREAIRWRLKLIPLAPLYKPVPKSFSGIHNTHTLSGRGMLIPESLIQKIGLFDEQLPQYGSDDDYACRARKAGNNVLVSWNTVVYTNVRETSAGAPHLKGPSTEFFKSFFNKYSVNSLHKAARYYKKHGITWLLPFYIAIFVAGTFKARYLK